MDVLLNKISLIEVAFIDSKVPSRSAPVCR